MAPQQQKACAVGAKTGGISGRSLAWENDLIGQRPGTWKTQESDWMREGLVQAPEEPEEGSLKASLLVPQTETTPADAWGSGAGAAAARPASLTLTAHFLSTPGDPPGCLTSPWVPREVLSVLQGPVFSSNNLTLPLLPPRI